MSIVSMQYEGDIAIITVNNPPVNAIGQSVRQGLIDTIGRLDKEDGVSAAIILCEGRTFMAGADIKEFGKPPVEPHLPDVVSTIEKCRKPVIAAIHGQALGGGLEIALGAHFRIASDTAKVGLPEVTLGIIPGAGGTQRLPRLIGPEAALDLIATGRPIKAEKAKDMGILDGLSSHDLKQDALKFTRDLLETEITDQTLSERRLGHRQCPAAEAGFFDQKRRELAGRRRGFEAPQACVDAVEAATILPFAEGMKREREIFMNCKSSPQAAAQRHMFFAERMSLKVEGLDKSVPARTVNKVAIIGAGTMGGGIAICFADAGYHVTLLEINPDALDMGMARIKKTYDTNAEKGRIDQKTKSQRLALINATTDYEDLKDADLVVEAAFEKMDVKKAIFSELDRVCKADCILATNTSYLDINEIASFVSRPENILGLHFFSPANIMKLLEIVRADKTADDVLQSALSITKKLGKIGVVSGVCHGFIGNRMYQGYQREAGLLLLEGASPSQIDKAITDFGMPMGPCAVGDLAGLDIGYFMRQSLDESQYEVRAFQVHNKLVEMDRKGQKTGAGFYTYADGARRGSPDAMVEQLIVDTAQELGIQRREISDQEIVERCIYALVNEGAKILEEGIAQRASDIDVVFCNGYGFPRWRGGPMHYAAHVGLDNVIRRMEDFAKTSGPRWWSVSDWLKENS